jgi:hypothetical protein
MLSGEMAAFDASQFKAINGDQGGSWSPTSAIVLGGQGVQIGGTVGLAILGGAFLGVSNGATANFYTGSALNIAGVTHVQSGAAWFFDNGAT